MSMTALIKGVCILFIVTGIPIALYGAWEIWGTLSLVSASPKRVKAKFVGYHREFHESSRIRSTDHELGGLESSEQVALYPEFTYRADDGTERRGRESKVHVVELYKPGDEVEIVAQTHGFARLAGFFSLYGRDLLILVIGLGFVLVPLAIWKGFIPALENTPAGAELAAFGDNTIKDLTNTVMEFKVGPVPYRYILGGVLALVVLGVIISVIAGLLPFFAQMRFGAGGRLIHALEQKRFEDARAMIGEGKGIRAKNEYNKNALLLALEAGQADLARLLIAAGADVNLRSKTNKTPLELAVRSGDLETVRMLLAYGALPDPPGDDFPMFFLAVAKGYDDMARILIEAGTDLHRRYRLKDFTVTVGDYAVLAKKPALAEFIRQRGGGFAGSISATEGSVK